MAQGSHHHGPGVHVQQGQGVVHDDGVWVVQCCAHSFGQIWK